MGDPIPLPLPEDEDVVSFDDFWSVYPRKEDKKRARAVWDRINPKLYLTIVIAIVDWSKVWEEQGRDSATIPMAKTWLGGEQWEDELPRPKRPEGTTAAHMPAVLPEIGKKTVMPQHVRDMLTKLRKKGS